MKRITGFLIAAMATVPLQAEAQGQPWQFRCPAQGTAVERSDGARLAYRGPDAGPLVCVTTNGQRRVLGYWNAASPLYIGNRTQLGELVAAAAAGQFGRNWDMYYFSPGIDGTSVHIKETWRIAGVEPVTTAAGRFDAVRLERVFQVMYSTYNYSETVWLDLKSGAPVKANVTHLNFIMAPGLNTWEAVEVRAPTVQSAR